MKLLLLWPPHPTHTKKKHLKNWHFRIHFLLFLSLLQISEAQFTCPSWFSAGAKRLINRILDPNPSTVSHYLNMNVEKNNFHEAQVTAWSQYWMIFKMNIFTIRSPLLVSACVACGILSYLVFYCYFNSGLQSLKYKKIHGLKKVTSNLFSIKHFKLV